MKTINYFFKSILFLVFVSGSMKSFAQCNVVGGAISSTAANFFCSGDGKPDLVAIKLTGNPGPNSRILFLDANGKIQDILNTLNFDMEGRPSDVYGVRQISYANGLQGLTKGSSINNLVGCYILSNTGFHLTVSNKEAGSLTTSTGATAITYCVSDGQADVPQILNPGNMAFGSMWLVTDLNDNVISVHFNMPNFEGSGAGTVRLRLATSCFEVLEIAPGTNINALPADMDYTNAITITKNIGCGPVIICAPEVKACKKDVLMCIKNVSTCVKSNKVNGYLKQGATMGGCVRCTTQKRMEAPEKATVEMEEDGLIIYPNPTNGIFSVANAVKANSTLELRNTFGELIWHRTLQTDQEENSVINLQSLHLAAGIYYFGVMNDQGRMIKPIVITN